VVDGALRCASPDARFVVSGQLGRLTPKDGAAFAEQLRSLGLDFLSPVLAQLDTTRVTRVAIAAQGFEANVAWHAVPISTAGLALGNRFDVVQLPNVSLLAHLVRGRSKPIRKAVFVACDPERKLKAHIEETLHAFSTIECDDKVVLIDQSRAIHADAVLAACAESDLLHFSGHSVLTPGDVHGSGLLLSDGLLSVARIEQALSSRVPSTVVLSSCDSAADDSRLSDALTLAGAFLQSGACTVIGAAWPVPDSIAAGTMLGFYGVLAEVGAVAALNDARRRLAAAVASSYSQSFKVVGWS